MSTTQSSGPTSKRPTLQGWSVQGTGGDYLVSCLLWHPVSTYKLQSGPSSQAIQQDPSQCAPLLSFASAGRCNVQLWIWFLEHRSGPRGLSRHFGFCTRPGRSNHLQRTDRNLKYVGVGTSTGIGLPRSLLIL